jgi:hypothetical protein
MELVFEERMRLEKELEDILPSLTAAEMLEAGRKEESVSGRGHR